MSIESDFDAFWAAFPKRQSKHIAMRQYQMAVYYKEATHEAIMKGVEAYKRHLVKKETDFQFIAAPDKWLAAGRWEDEYEANLPKPEFNDETVRVGETYSQMQRRLGRISVVK